MWTKFKSWRKKRLFFIPLLGIMTFFSFFLLLDVFFPLDLTKAKTLSQQYLSEKGEVMHVTLARDDMYRLPVTLDEVSERYLKLLIAREDHRFYEHLGVDIRAVFRALHQCIRHGRVVSGASTLTMQTARLLEPRPRTFGSKCIEMLRALQLEWHFSKAEILTLYLTLVPCGGNIEGIKAASHAYFNKKPDRLSVAEASFLAMIPQSPTQLRPDRFLEEARLKRDQLLAYFYDRKLISEDELAFALSEKMPETRHVFPRELPHFAGLIKSKEPLVSTYINSGLQRFLSELLTHHQGLPAGSNAAILVHDHEQNKVIAYAGSRNFFDAQNQGQVDYIQAIRSPGSTLKPLIFALAFDGGHITPETYFFDERKHFGAYAPHNFDHQHYGLVKGAESLQMSLNIPAVELLKKIGPIYFYGALRDMNLMPHFKDPSVIPNLSMALGGVGMSLQDLVKLYSTFAEDGMCRDLRFLKSDVIPEPRYALYPSAAQQLTEILKVNPLNIRGHLGHRPVALKTGTSYGHRDALALAYDEKYTIGVWVGMPKGTSLGYHTGLDLAVPFIDAIFQRLPKSTPSQTHQPLDIAPLFKTKSLTKKHVFVKPGDVSRRPLAMHFPLPGATLFLDTHKPVALKVGGGKKPYHFYVNGDLLGRSLWRDEVFWQPQQKGFYRLTVQDAEGHSVASEIEIN